MIAEHEGRRIVAAVAAAAGVDLYPVLTTETAWRSRTFGGEALAIYATTSPDALPAIRAKVGTVEIGLGKRLLADIGLVQEVVVGPVALVRLDAIVLLN